MWLGKGDGLEERELKRVRNGSVIEVLKRIIWRWKKRREWLRLVDWDIGKKIEVDLDERIGKKVDEKEIGK